GPRTLSGGGGPRLTWGSGTMARRAESRSPLPPLARAAVALPPVGASSPRLTRTSSPPSATTRAMATRTGCARNACPILGARGTFTAEREGFEPSRELLAPYSLSRRVPSAARPPLQAIGRRGATGGPIVGWTHNDGSRQHPGHDRGGRDRFSAWRADPGAGCGTPRAGRHADADPASLADGGLRALRGGLRRDAGAVRLHRPRRRLVERRRHASPLTRQADQDRQQVDPLPARPRAAARPRPRVPGSPLLHPPGDAVALGARNS